MITVVVSGPIFDGRAHTATQDFLQQLKLAVAWQYYAEVMTIMDQSFRHPTPYYELQVTVQQRGTDMVVHDRGIVYGPWLEGVSHRNQITVFKGYHMFRRAVQAVIPQVQTIAYQTLAAFIRRING